MILLKQDVNTYNNDIRAMLLAFFPLAKIKEATENADEVMEECSKDNVPCYIFEVHFDESGARIKLEVSESNASFGIKTGVFEESVLGDYRDKKSFRNLLKKGLYHVLSDYAGRKLPWGDLTGVRPVKIAMQGIAEGKTCADNFANYVETYEVSEEKARLAVRVSARERAMIENLDLPNSYCLYVGIPFCPTRCVYCSFASNPVGGNEEKIVKYLECLKAEITEISELIAKMPTQKKLVAIYVGGGTPTSINAEQLKDLLDHVTATFDMKDCLEFTVEAGRPDSITVDKLKAMKAAGVTRISINPQTFNDETLKKIYRLHDADAVKNAFAMAREEGFDNINMDLIAGLPDEREADMQHTLDEVFKLGPESVTVHSLAIKRAAKLKEQLNDFEDSINHETEKMLDLVLAETEKHDLNPYYLYRQKNIAGNLENVGYAKEGKECLYNVLIMEELTDIIAAGAGTSTKLVFHEENRVERVENCKSVDDYIGRFDEMIDRKRIGMKDKFVD